MPSARPLEVGGAALLELKRVSDPRGNLVVAEIGQGLPFVPRRCFVISDVPSRKIRGEHAHKTLEQMLVCIRGRVAVLVDDGRRREEVVLDDAALGIYIPPRIWAAQYDYSPDSILVVFASAPYDPADYIRDYAEFMRYVQA